MKRTLWKTAAVAAVAALALTACSSGDSGDSEPTASSTGPDTSPVTLNFTWWGNDDRADRYNEALALFKEKYPYITVQTSFAAFPDYWTARSTEAAGRALPDVMQFDLSYLREFNQNGQLLDLQEWVDNGTIDLSGFDETLTKAGVLDDKMIGIPTSTNTFAMFQNPNVIEQTGATFPDEAEYTWDDYNDFIADVSGAGEKTADGYGLYGAVDYTGTFWFFIQWLLQKGITPFEDDGTFGFDEGDVVEFLDLTADLRADKLVYPDGPQRLAGAQGRLHGQRDRVRDELGQLPGRLRRRLGHRRTSSMAQIPSIEPGEKAPVLQAVDAAVRRAPTPSTPSRPRR